MNIIDTTKSLVLGQKTQPRGRHRTNDDKASGELTSLLNASSKHVGAADGLSCHASCCADLFGPATKKGNAWKI